MHLRATISLTLLLCILAPFLCKQANARPQGLAKPQAQGNAAAAKSPEKPQEKTPPPTEPETPAQITLLETHYRFEADGSSRKEVHTMVKINSELGVRQFAHLNFDYNRAWQSVEIPMVRVTHSSGGTADVLPSAITDMANEAVKDAPAYQDVRVKSVRILGLEPSDTLEYRVITTVAHHPLAPDFWLDHSFDRSGVVSKEIFELDLPAPRLRIRINADTPATATEKSGEGDAARLLYRWDLAPQSLKPPSPASSVADIALTTFSSWSRLVAALSAKTTGLLYFTTALWYDAMKRIGAPSEPVAPRLLYDFVSSKIVTLDIPVDLAGYSQRTISEIMTSGYGTSEEKVRLLAALLGQDQGTADHLEQELMCGHAEALEQELPRPSLLSSRLLTVMEAQHRYFLDPALEVAPFGMLPADLRGRKALLLSPMSGAENDEVFTTIPEELPFPARQRVNVDATLNAEGTLTAKIRYVMRGDNELLLRIAFHQSPREKWTELAQLLSLSDGFRGKISSVSASDPLATKDPFTVEYEIAQPKFVDWSKKPVRIPALLPLFALPDPPAQVNSAIELGTPLDVETTATLTLPAGFTAQSPTGTSVTRDYATFTSKYSFDVATRASTITASRHINFLARQLPALSNADYRAFLRAVQNDEAQSFAITKP